MITVTDLNTLRITAHGQNVCAELDEMEPAALRLASIYSAQNLGTSGECRRMAWNVIKRFMANSFDPNLPALCRPDYEPAELGCFLDYPTHTSIS